MSVENTFNTEEDFKITRILDKAYSIKDPEERAVFVEDECGGNVIMYEEIIKALKDMFGRETGSTDPFLINGDEVGNYIITDDINSGGFATVYQAEHKTLKTLVAIKVFDKRLELRSAENGMIWSKDHSSLSKFNHDNIVKLYDAGTYEKNGIFLDYIVIEYVHGKHLDKFCRIKKLSVREVLRLFQNLCEVIEYIHDKEKILHLDLKPSNILVTSDRPHLIKLIDFGSSKFIRTDSKQATLSDLLTPATLKFSPPEQLDRDESTTNQSDVYSLGAILYLLLTEKVPFGEGEENTEVIKQKVGDLSLVPVVPSERILESGNRTKFGISTEALGEILRGDLDAIVMKALKKKESDRYQSVSELRRDISNFLKGKPVNARSDTLGYAAGKSFFQYLGFRGGLSGWDKWKSPVKRLSVAAFFLILLGVIGAVVFFNRKPEIEKNIAEPAKRLIRIWNEQKLLENAEISYVDISCGANEPKEICFYVCRHR